MRLTLGFYERSFFFNVVLSIVFHSLLFFLVIHKQSAAPLERLESVEFIDETLPPSSVKAPRTISPLQALKNMFTKEEDLPSLSNEDVSEMLKSLPPVPGVDETKGIDISSKDIDRSQTAIDLDSYDDFEGAEGGVTDIIRVGSSQKSTEEILQAPSIIIKDKGGPKRGQIGLYTSAGGSGSEAPLELEKEPVSNIAERPTVAPITSNKNESMKIKGAGKRSGPSVSITGPLSGRKILAKYLPPYPEWALKQGVSAVVQIRFWVTPSGVVKTNAFIERTSGSGSWDNSAKKALVKWRFAALPPNVIQETQWGIITIKFTL